MKRHLYVVHTPAVPSSRTSCERGAVLGRLSNKAAPAAHGSLATDMWRSATEDLDSEFYFILINKGTSGGSGIQAMALSTRECTELGSERLHTNHTGGPPTFLAPGIGFVGDNFSTDSGEWFQDDSISLHLLYTLFLSLLHQLHLSSTGIRSGRLRTPVYLPGNCRKTRSHRKL